MVFMQWKGILCNKFSFKAGEIVIEYVGEVISNRMADFREKEYNLRGYEDCYFFRLDSTKIVFINILIIRSMLQISEI